MEHVTANQLAKRLARHEALRQSASRDEYMHVRNEAGELVGLMRGPFPYEWLSRGSIAFPVYRPSKLYGQDDPVTRQPAFIALHTWVWMDEVYGPQWVFRVPNVMPLEELRKISRFR